MTTFALKRRFTVDEFHRMGEAGVLGEDDRVELIDGEVLTMTPIGPRHASCVRRLIALLSRLAAGAAIVDAQNPLPIGEFVEPQPDIVLLRPRPDFYRDAHPRPSDALLVIEVAESSADYDRTIKAPLYARGGIPELWIVNLHEQVVEVYRHPESGRYAEQLIARRGTSISLPTPGAPQIAIDDIVG